MSKRAGRVEWWCLFLFVGFAGNQLKRMADGTVLSSLPDSTPPAVLISVLTAIQAVTTAAVLWFQWKTTERRAHDVSAPVWPFWVYAALTVALVSVRIIGQVYGWLSSSTAWLLLGAQAAAFIGLALYFGLRPGDRRANAWGAPPKPFFDFNSPKPDNYRPPRV